MSECIADETIDLTPDSDGYTAFGAAFVAQLRQDFLKARREDATFLLESVIDLAFAFGFTAGTMGDEARGIVLRDKLFSRIGGKPTPDKLY
jgi:hypothetical protein